jgi:F-type H+-transporting ATPase subunit b
MIRVMSALTAAWALAGTAPAYAAEQSGGLPQLDAHDFAPQLAWLAVCFLVLLLIMSRFALPRIGEVLEERRDRIRRDLESAERLKGEAEAALAAYEKALAEARANASAMARKTREALRAEIDEERANLERELAARTRAAEARIAADKTRALASVTGIAAGAVGTIVQKLIGKDVSPDEISRALSGRAGGPQGPLE